MVRRLREVVSLMRRDLAAPGGSSERSFGRGPPSGLWDQLRDTAVLTARALRRQVVRLKNSRPIGWNLKLSSTKLATSLMAPKQKK